MKTDIHPPWYSNARVVCACGNTFTVGSTRQEIRVEICSQCHPFFTGQMKFVDTGGQVERFEKKKAVGQAKAADLATKKAKKLEKEKQIKEGPKTLKEMLMGK